MASYQKTQSPSDDDELGILLMGITGNGKSATGNSILGRKEFISRGGASSVTKDYHVGHTFIDGRVIKVVDIPGFQDTDASSLEDEQDIVINALTKAITKFPNGFHAVLLVVSYNTRLTEEMHESIVHLVRLFDENAFKMNGILLLTHGDSFVRDYGREMTIQQWMTEASIECRWIFETCSRRCVLFNNVTDDEGKMNSQVKELLHQIINMETDDARYIPNICNYTGSEKAAFIEDRMKVAEVERISGLLGLLKDNLYKSQRVPSHLRYERMAQLEKDVEYIRKIIETQKNTAISSCLEENLSECMSIIRQLTHVEPGNNELVEKLGKTISSMQKDLDEQIEGTSFWSKIKQQLSKFFKSEEFENAVKFIAVWFGKVILKKFAKK